MNLSMTTLALLATMVAQANPIMNFNQKKFTADLIEALRINCVGDYVRLIPTIEELNQLMDMNAGVYGPFLGEAKADFASHYEAKTLPKLKAEFDTLINEGRKRGIVWPEIEVLGSENTTSDNSTPSFIITLQSGKKVYRILIEDALIINGQWRIGRAVRFV